MGPDRHARADELLDRALDLPTTERAGYLDRACSADPTLRAEVGALVAHAERAEADGFLADPTPLPAAAPRPVVPGYEVVRELGRGGAGVVYLARQVGARRLVALKVIGGGRFAGPDERARFRREAEAAGRLRHPNLVTVYDVGEQDGCPYVALEYVPGGTLAQQLAGAPLPARAAAELVETLARAVDHAHRHGVVHRDLKPANILLGSAELGARNSERKTEDGGGSDRSELRAPSSALLPKVADFGLAWVSGEVSAATRTGAVMGTPSYLAPEQAEGRPAGPAADVYALGAVLYECLTGRPPFKAATAAETLLQVRDVEPVSPARLQPGVPRDLETVCRKCLAKAADRRYPSAGELADDLRRYLESRPVRARPTGAMERAWRWARRNPALTAAGLVAGVAVAAVVAVSVAFGVAKARDADRLAAAARALATERDRGETRRAEAELAADGERAARAQTEKRLGQIDRGNDILHSVFADLDPGAEEKEGKPLRATLGERLDRAVAALDAEAVGDPLVVAKLQGRLAESLLGLGYPEKAADLFRKARETFAARLGPDHADTLRLLAHLGRCYGDLGRHAEAAALRLERLSALRGKLPADGPALAAEMALAADSLLLAGQFREAEPLLRECLAAREKHAPDAWATADTRSTLGAARLGRREYADAETLLLDGFRGLRERERAIPPQARGRLRDAADRLVRLYEGWGKPGDAAAWRAVRDGYPVVAPPPRPKP